MENTVHILEEGFETAIVLAGLFYGMFWMGGRKLTNGEALLLFAIGFAVSLLLNLLSSRPTYLFLIAGFAPSLLFRLCDFLAKKFCSHQKSAI